MGVLPCDRAGCENIMCDRLSSRYGYICWECFEDLIDSGTTDIKEFMGRELKYEEKPDLEFYEKIFPVMHGSPFHPDTPSG